MYSVMQKTKFVFTNGLEIRVIKAIDGPTAWKVLTSQVGFVAWHGGKELPKPNKWSLQIVCPCGAKSSFMFCSQICYIERVA